MTTPLIPDSVSIADTGSVALDVPVCGVARDLLGNLPRTDGSTATEPVSQHRLPTASLESNTRRAVTAEPLRLQPNLAAVPSGAGVLGMEKWQGVVIEVTGDILTAEITSLDHDDSPLQADFDLGLLGPDASTVAVGDVLYLTVRTVTDGSGYRTRTSTLRLRRLGKWTEADVRQARTRALDWMGSLAELMD